MASKRLPSLSERTMDRAAQQGADVKTNSEYERRHLSCPRQRDARRSRYLNTTTAGSGHVKLTKLAMNFEKHVYSDSWNVRRGRRTLDRTVAPLSRPDARSEAVVSVIDQAPKADGQCAKRYDPKPGAHPQSLRL
jgi:hypothetical protein